jgi:exodeoxyribonuclease VII large subunit
METQFTRTSNTADAPPAISVSELTRRIQRTLGERFQSVWVSGELSDVSQPSSGHIYFTLKDADAQIRGVIWRRTAEQIPFELRDGLQVICQGKVDIYPPRGSYQLIVNQVEPIGEGALQLAFRQLRGRLEKEGLFRPELKRPLPVFPRRVVVVTSPTGAAVRDFLQVVRRRWPYGRVLVVPARVQGEGASGELARALAQIHELRHRPDIIVLTRGGGSLEDLWAFNEERLVRAIHRSTIPIISAVGHEIDVTLSDLAADVRALTPTEAGERIATSREQWLGQLQVQKERLAQGLRNHCRRAATRIEGLERRLNLQHPKHRLQRWGVDLQQQTQILRREMTRLLETKQRQLATQAEHLEALSPLAVLSRGYSITTDTDGSPLLSAQSLEAGDIIHTRLHEGMVVSRVESRGPDAPKQ